MRTLVVVTAAVILVGATAATAYYLYPDEGTRLERGCVSLVDTVLKQDPRVSPEALANELARRGLGRAPQVPPHPYNPGGDRSARGMAAHQEAQRAHDQWWENVQRTPAYKVAWESAFADKRDEAIRDCVYDRAMRAGVRAR